MSHTENTLYLKAYIDGREAEIAIPYESLFDLFEFKKQYEEYAKDSSESPTSANADDIIRDSAKLFIKHGVCSTELLQRHFHIGYGRATQIIDELEKLNIITSPIKNQRFIRVKNEEELNKIFK